MEKDENPQENKKNKELEPAGSENEFESYALEDYIPEDEFELEEENEGWLPPLKLVIAAVVLLAICAGGFFIARTQNEWVNQYKTNFMRNIKAIFPDWGTGSGPAKEEQATPAPTFQTQVENTYILPFENASGAQFAPYDTGVVVAKSNYMAYISGDGQNIWNMNTSVVEPILKAEGSYILLAEKNGKKICLYNQKKLIYARDIEDNIITANMSSNGDVVIVTSKEYYQGAVVVYNKDGNQIFAWNSGSDSILSADIAASSRRVAVSLLNADTRAYSTVMLFDVTKPESYAAQKFEDTIAFDMEFLGETLNVMGDNIAAGISIRGKVLWTINFEDMEFTHYAFDQEGNKMLLFDNKNIPQVNFYGKSGRQKSSLTADELPDFIDLLGDSMLYNSGRDVVFGKIKGNGLKKYTSSMDIQNLMMVSPDTFLIVYNNSLEFVKM